MRIVIYGDNNLPESKEMIKRLIEMLEERGDSIKKVPKIHELINVSLSDYDIIIPIWPGGMGNNRIITYLLKAVGNGLGLAYIYDGINKDNTYIDESKSKTYYVRIHKKNNAFAHLNDFICRGEVCDIRFLPDYEIVANCCIDHESSPYAWISQYGMGRIFFSMGAGDYEALFSDGCIRLILRGIELTGRIVGYK